MSPPFTVVPSPFAPPSSDLSDDSTPESEILFSICQKTLVDVDIVTDSMNSCLLEGYSALNRRFFWSESGSGAFDLAESGFHLEALAEIEDSRLLDSMVPETEFDELPESELQESFLLDSMVAETQFDELPESKVEAPSLLDCVVPDTQFDELPVAKKRKVRGGGYGGATAETASVKAVEKKEMNEVRDAMLRILLPRFYQW